MRMASRPKIDEEDDPYAVGITVSAHPSSPALMQPSLIDPLSSTLPSTSSSSSSPLSSLPPPATSSSPSSSSRPSQELRILGFPLPSFTKNPNMRVRFLIALVISVYLLFFILQESLFKKQNCKYGGFVTLVQFVMYFSFAMAERKRMGNPPRRGPLRYHAEVAFFCAMGFTLSNYSMQLLNFPTWLLFKSARVVATMIGGVLILKRHYGAYEYSGVLLIFVGLVVFTVGDWSVLPEFNVPGIALVLLALASNAAQDNFQEKGMREYGVTENELVVHSYGFGSLMLVPWLIFNGELVAGTVFCWEHPLVFLQILVGGVLSYAGVVLVLALLNQTSALVAVITTSCRKALSIITSFLLFSKPFSVNYIYGTLFVFGGVLLNFYGKRKRPSPPRR